MEDFPKVTDEMRKRVETRRAAFVSAVLQCSDADDAMLYASGWGTRGKAAWLASICASYRKDMHKILGD